MGFSGHALLARTLRSRLLKLLPWCRRVWDEGVRESQRRKGVFISRPFLLSNSSLLLNYNSSLQHFADSSQLTLITLCKSKTSHDSSYLSHYILTTPINTTSITITTVPPLIIMAASSSSQSSASASLSPGARPRLSPQAAPFVLANQANSVRSDLSPQAPVFVPGTSVGSETSSNQSDDWEDSQTTFGDIEQREHQTLIQEQLEEQQQRMARLSSLPPDQLIADLQEKAIKSLAQQLTEDMLTEGAPRHDALEAGGFLHKQKARRQAQTTERPPTQPEIEVVVKTWFDEEEDEINDILNR